MVVSWFNGGLLLAGAEEQLSFYNYNKSLELFSSIWYQAGTGYPQLNNLTRVPYFYIFSVLSRIGIPDIFLQALTFFILMAIGTLSVYWVVKVTIGSDLKERWSDKIPFVAALFYLLNPFSMTQVWGRALSYQFFAFALIPAFLLGFILSLKTKNMVYIILGSFASVFLSVAYLSPAVVISSWSIVGVYLLSHIYIHRRDKQAVSYSLLTIGALFIVWTLVNFFWIYPTVMAGREMVANNLRFDNVGSLKGVGPNSRLDRLIRLIYREHYAGVYGELFNNALFIISSWLLPIVSLLSFNKIKKIRYGKYYLALMATSLFVCLGANWPSGWLFIWLFNMLPLLQVLRNPYEKYGLNLVIAYAPFFAIGIYMLSDSVSKLIKAKWPSQIIPLGLILLYCVFLVLPLWRGDFAGGARGNFWVKIPEDYGRMNKWLNEQKGDFNILQLPLIPEEGVTYTWEHPYEGVEPSEFIFDKGSIARNTVVNKDYYSALIERFGATVPFKNFPNWGNENLDFKDQYLMQELAKLNVRYVILHNDTNYKYRNATSPDDSKVILDENNIKKVHQFGDLEVYKVEIPDNVDLFYSPDTKVSFIRTSATSYHITTNHTDSFNLFFLQQFDPGWEAYVSGQKIEKHKKIFSYANVWNIDKVGDLNIDIRYKPQELFIIGSRVSIASSIIGSLMIVLYLIKMRKLSF